MTNQEAIDKMEYCKRAYQMLIDENSQEGILVGKGCEGQWKADTPLYKVYEDMRDACNMAIKALEQEPSGDLISRQAVDEIKELMTDINGDTVYAVRMSDIRQLSSVNPQEPKTGHWIALENRFELGDRVKCSECGQVFVVGDNVSRHYCPNCGARMVEPQERSEKE